MTESTQVNMRPFTELALALRYLPVECVLADQTTVRVVAMGRPDRTLLHATHEGDGKWYVTWPDDLDRDDIADAAGVAAHVSAIVNGAGR
jgi:hypothetical protein